MFGTSPRGERAKTGFSSPNFVEPVPAAHASMDACDNGMNRSRNERFPMARYVSLIRFTAQGARAIKKSTARAAAFRQAAAKAGVRVEAQYWTVGTYDGLLIISATNERHALRQLAKLAGAGNVRSETLLVLTEGEFEAVLGK